jgi:hypothetical protein
MGCFCLFSDFSKQFFLPTDLFVSNRAFFFFKPLVQKKIKIYYTSLYTLALFWGTPATLQQTAYSSA